MSLAPNIVIFRLPLTEDASTFDLEAGKQVPAFVQINIVDFKIDPATASMFTVTSEDGYTNLTLDKLVFAHLSDGVSTEIGSVSLSTDDGEPARIYEIGYHALNEMLPDILHELYHTLDGTVHAQDHH